MALSLCDLQALPSSSFRPRQTHLNIRPKALRFAAETNSSFNFSSLRRYNNRFARISAPKSASLNGFLGQSNNPEESSEELRRKSNEELSNRLLRWVVFVRSILPGGRWWSFPEHVEVALTAKPVTLLRALSRMWELISKDRWVIFAAFTSLIITAFSEISIPHYLTASIFSAQSGEIAVFHRNVHLLILLCLIAGICRFMSRRVSL